MSFNWSKNSYLIFLPFKCQIPLHVLTILCCHGATRRSWSLEVIETNNQCKHNKNGSNRVSFMCLSVANDNRIQLSVRQQSPLRQVIIQPSGTGSTSLQSSLMAIMRSEVISKSDPLFSINCFI